MLTNMSIFKSMYSGPRTPFRGGGQDQGAGASGSGSKGHSGSGSGKGNNKGDGKQKGGYNPHTKSGYSQGQQFKGQTVSKDANTQSGGEGGGREAERRRAAMFDRLRAQDMLTKNAATALANEQAQAAKIAENKKVADEMEAERIAALAKKYSAPEESLLDKLKNYQKFNLGPFDFEIDQEGLKAEYGDFEANVGPKGFGLGYNFADGGRIGFEDGSQDPFYTDGNQRLEDLSYSELQELAENMMLMEYDNPVLLDERKREYFRNKYPMNVMGERSTKGIMDEKLLNRLENSRDFKNYIDI